MVRGDHLMVWLGYIWKVTFPDFITVAEPCDNFTGLCECPVHIFAFAFHFCDCTALLVHNICGECALQL